VCPQYTAEEELADDLFIGQHGYDASQREFLQSAARWRSSTRVNLVGALEARLRLF
jgi:hypothetical protein